MAVGAQSSRRETPIDVQPPAERIESAVEALKLVADSVRLRILWALLSGERSVNDLAEIVGAPQSTVSRHLSRLRSGRLVRSRREGTRVIYSVQDGHVSSLVKEAVYHTNHIPLGGAGVASDGDSESG